jgi:hypothetical protein
MLLARIELMDSQPSAVIRVRFFRNEKGYRVNLGDVFFIAACCFLSRYSPKNMDSKSASLQFGSITFAPYLWRREFILVFFVQMLAR